MIAESAVRAAHQRGAAFADLLRPYTARLALLPFLVAGVGHSSGRHLVGGSALILCAYGLAAAFNDVHDLEIDRANGRQRPLVTGVLSVRDARMAMLACAGGVGLSQLLLDQPLGLLVTVAALGASAAYSSPRIGLERHGVLGTGMLAVTYFVLPVLLAGRPAAPAVLAALVAGGTATLLYKDVKDEPGDRLLGKRTPLVRWGMRWMETVAAVLGVAGLVLGLLAIGPGWWTLALLGGLVTQLAMAVTGARQGRLFTVHRLLVMGGLVAMAAPWRS